jgi:uncharacterized protein
MGGSRRVMGERMSETLLIETPGGPGRLHVDRAGDAVATIVLGHGAGGGVAAADLDLLARRLPSRGVTVLRFEQPWRLAGRRVAVAPPQLDVAWRAMLDRLLADDLLTPAWYAGGRSAGARVACRTASDYPLAGVVCLAFPLHPPGRPDRSRVAELLAPPVPRLVLQGTRDTFGSAEEVRDAVGPDPGIELVELPGADHSLRVPAAAASTPAAVRARVLDSVAEFVLRTPRDSARRE